MVDKQREKSKEISGNRDSYKRGENPKSLANLKPFVPGVSGNPAGRPVKYEALKRQLNKLGDEEITDFMGEKLGKRRDIVLKQIWKESMNGDMKFIQLLAELGCLDGKN
tara:strand:- start:110 stop:436 length:327 start_codon:yes stop_codon:yes gene_type:complete